jgi:hypothetical protein
MLYNFDGKCFIYQLYFMVGAYTYYTDQWHLEGGIWQ